MHRLLRETILSYDFIAFKECNNDCTFCFQKNTENTSFTDEADVLKRFNLVIEDIKKKHAKYSEIQIDFTGGELFFRKGLQSMYYKIFDLVKDLKTELQKPVRCLLGTNLLYEDTALLYDVLKYVIQLDKSLLRGVFTSFDIVGRFRTISKVELHRKNTLQLLEFLSQNKIHLASISVLTKEAIHKFMKPDDELSIRIKQVYDEYYAAAQKFTDLKSQNWWFRLSWTLMSPNSLDPSYTEKMVPTSDDIFMFYKHLVDNYGTLAVIEAFYSRQLSLRCGDSCYVCKKDCIEKSCDSNIYGDELLKSENLHVPSNKPIDIYRHLMKRYSCITCKYFQHCYIRPCPVVANLKTVEVGDECWRKRVYQYVDQKHIS